VYGDHLVFIFPVKVRILGEMERGEASEISEAA
jgi:hypothetical protein